MTGLLVLSWMKRFDLVLAGYWPPVIVSKSAGTAIRTTGRCGAEGRFTVRGGALVCGKGCGDRPAPRTWWSSPAGPDADPTVVASPTTSRLLDWIDRGWGPHGGCSDPNLSMPRPLPRSMTSASVFSPTPVGLHRRYLGGEDVKLSDPRWGDHRRLWLSHFMLGPH